MNKMQAIINLNHIWKLENFVEKVVVDMRSTGFLYTSTGDRISTDVCLGERQQSLEEHIENSKNDMFNFASNPLLSNISFEKAVGMSLEEIFDSFLTSDVLSKVRGILRKDSRNYYGMVVSDEISDDFLNQLIAIRWRENLKLWSMQHEVARDLCTDTEEQKKTREEYLSELAEKLGSDMDYANAMYPAYVETEADGIVNRNLYYWHREIGNIQTVTMRQLPSQKLMYRFRLNREQECSSSIEGVMEAIATNPYGFSMEEWLDDYSKQEIAFLNKYHFNIKNATKNLEVEKAEEYAVMELDFARFLGHTQVGAVVLIEKKEDEAIIACGWDEFITKISLTEEGILVLESNLKISQLRYTKAVMNGYRSFLWKMIME